MHRWYDAQTGRWISEDPIGFAAGDANLTRYVGNASAINVDPSGLVSSGHHLLPQQLWGNMLTSAAQRFNLSLDEL
ncbi:MAG: hypothetical protein KDA99_07335, partial [Planctomycetales bacterium]|nr:hypothetical protein [Planctomycetales bacterium]